MAYEISKTAIQGVWQVAFQGMVSAAERHTAVSDGIRLTAGKELSGILVDLTSSESSMSTLEEFGLGRRVAAEPRFRSVRIAFLHAREETQASEFLETVEANRGALTSIFADREQALNWLSGESLSDALGRHG